MDGPFGESHQDWYRYPVAVLVGGGIGITPFASILKDIAHRSKNLARVPCQKVNTHSGRSLCECRNHIVFEVKHMRLHSVDIMTLQKFFLYR